jgi:flagellar hook assembly protein FlgD
MPSHVTLNQNNPNPFNIETRISFNTDITGFVFLEILDFTGREVRTLVLNNLDPGDHSIIWKGENNQGDILPSGVYFYRLSHSQDNRSISLTKKMILIK